MPNVHVVSSFEPNPADDHARRRDAHAFMTRCRELGATFCGSLAIFQGAWETTIRDELEPFRERGKLIVGLLASPDI